jgi:hypothetical protein
MSDFAPETQRWFVAENDLYGGWSIVNVDVEKVSQLRNTQDHRTLVDDIPTEELAHYIVSLHNYLHRTRFPEQWKEGVA